MESILISLLSWGWDPLFIGQYLRDGRTEIYMLFALALASWHFGKTWCPATGAFYFFANFFPIVYHFPGWTVMASIQMTLALWLIPMAYKRLKAVENAILLGGVINSIFAVLNLFSIYVFPHSGRDPLYERTNPIVGMIGQHMFLAMFMVMAFHIALKQRRFVLAALFVCVVAIAKSAIGYVALIGSLLVYVPTRYRYWYAGALGVGLLIATQFTAFSGRLTYWSAAVKIATCQKVEWNNEKYVFPCKPLVGTMSGGWSMTSNYLGTTDPRRWTELHNELLQSLVEYGIIGVLLLLLHATYINPHANKYYLAILLATLINSLGSYPMRITPIAQIAMLALYISLRHNYENEPLSNGN